MVLGTLKGIVLTGALVGSSIAGTATVLITTDEIDKEHKEDLVIKPNTKTKSVPFLTT
ncbi:TPA: hypothetical protein QCX08_004177 [Bacillus cytotoxicus]|uniref:hypothetical protein n=1 Tax=Bacillus cytotoxicus TaxID=580165 RepID=UPI000A635112|nr:hypothetical protein [Bacillus cytotoxicus]HDR7311638.1 hypothetical protein [Bacillus cytotoxicus]HDR7866219.1 hypothetical protein [Bacillus cytotoxicus]